MISVAVICSKGGTGKSSTSVALASIFASENTSKPTLLIDLDGQGSASDALGFDNHDGQQMLLSSMLGEMPVKDAVVETTVENLDLIPASWNLYSAASHFHDVVGADGLLEAMLKPLENQYFAVIIDCPPNIGILNYNAAIAAKNGLLVPCEASHSAMRSMNSLLRVVTLLQQRRCPTVHILGITPTRVVRSTNSGKEAVSLLRESFGDLVTSTEIDEAVAIRDCPSHRKPITEYKPKSKAAKQYRALAKEILNRIKQPLREKKRAA